MQKSKFKPSLSTRGEKTEGKIGARCAFQIDFLKDITAADIEHIEGFGAILDAMAICGKMGYMEGYYELKRNYLAAANDFAEAYNIENDLAGTDALRKEAERWRGRIKREAVQKTKMMSE
jgi:hypothetical protein